MTFRAVASASAVGTVASKKKLRRGLWYEGGREGAAEIRCEFASLIHRPVLGSINFAAPVGL